MGVWMCFPSRRSYRTSLYRDVGDRLAGATLLSIEQHQGIARDGFQINGHIYDSVQTEFFYDAEHGGVDNLPGAVSDGLGRLQRFAIPEGVDVTNPIPEPKTYGFEADGVVGTMQPTTHGRTSHIKDGFGTFSTGGEKAKNGTDVNIFTRMTYGDKPATAPQEAGYLTEVSTGEGGDQRAVKLTPDEAGRVEERATIYGTASKTTYDEWDRVIRSVTGIGGGVFADVSATTELAYDERGRLIHQRQKQHGLASGGGWAETDITYNERDQVLTVKENGLASEVRGGALTEGTTINTYLNSGLLDTVKSPGGVTVKYEYGAGRVSSVSRVGVEGTRHVAYDAMGRVVFTSDGDEGVARAL